MVKELREAFDADKDLIVCTIIAMDQEMVIGFKEDTS